MKTKFAIIAVAASLAASLAGPTPALAGHHHHHHGAYWGAALGGTALGFLMGSATAQSARPAQPQVVVLQPPPAPEVRDTTYIRSAEMERLRQRNVRLEWELERLRARQARGKVIVENAAE